MATNENNPKGGEQVILGVSLDTTVADQQGQDLANSLKGVGNNIGTSSVKSFKAQLKEAKEEALRLQMAGQQGSAEWAKQVKIIAQLKDEMDVLGRTTQAYDPGNKFQALNKVASLTASSLGGLTGAMTLFGVSAETANEQIAKLQSISAIVALLDTWGDSIDFLQPFLQRLGLVTTATAVQTQAQEVQVVATEAQIRATQQATIAENDKRIADLAAAAAATARAEAEVIAESARLRAIGTTEAEILAEQQATLARYEGAAASGVQTTALEAQTVATTGASVAAKVLKVALASIGIGLILVAIGYLVENWNTLKKSITDAFPAFDGAGKIFTKIKNIAMGVGGVIVQYLIAPIKALGKLLSGEFKQAMVELSKGMDVVGNFKAGKLAGEVADAKKKNAEILKNDIETLEHRIKVMKAGGKNTDALERSIFNKKKQLYADDEVEFKKTIQEKEIFEAGAIKRIADKRKADAEKAAQEAKAKKAKDKADREAQEKEYLKFVEEARKKVNQSNLNTRDKEINDVQVRYKKELDLAEKLGKSKVDIEKAQAAEIAQINMKYADEVATYLAGKDAEKLNAFDRQRKTINDEIEKLKVNADEAELLRLDKSKADQLAKVTDLETLTNNANSSASLLDSTKTLNASNDKDKPEVARQKITNIRNAELLAELDAFNLKKLQLAGQKSELEQLEKDHANNILAINTAQTEANIELSEKEKQQKIDNLTAVSNMLGNASALFAENTISYKAFAVAQAGIDTYLAAQSAYKSMVGIPVVGPALGAAAAGIAVVGGLANVKKIVSVKIPKAATTGSGIGGASPFTAPTINSTVLKQSESGISNLTSTVQSKNDNVRAYIVEDDLNKQNERKRRNDNLSTI